MHETKNRMRPGIASAAGLTALALLLFTASACADEIKLKDGSKITGTIVGFEDNSFKVKTSYGFAVVQKDQVVSITVTDAAKKPEPDDAKRPPPESAKKPDADAVKKPVAAPIPPPALKSEKIEHASATPTTTTTTPTTTPIKTPEPESGASADNSVVEYPHVDTPTSSAKDSAPPAATASNTSNAPTSIAAAAPPKPAAPEPMREEVS